MDEERYSHPITLEKAISGIEVLSEEYRLDTEMSSDRARLYMGWLDETVETVKEISSQWSPTLKTIFTQTAANLLNGRYFRYGTEYGTGYGGRPMVEIVRSLKYFSYLPEEETITYLKVLETVYTCRHLRPAILDPLNFFQFSGSETDKQFLHPLVQELNERLERAAQSPTARKKEINIIPNFIIINAKQAAATKEIPGFEFLNGRQILERLEIPYKDIPPKPAVIFNKLVEKTYSLDDLTPQIKEGLMAELERKAEAVRKNFSDFETPGLSENTLNQELADIWREIEEIFYQTLADNL